MDKRRLYIFAVSFLLLASFYLFSRQVGHGFLKQTDFNTTVKIQEKVDTSSRLRIASFVGNVMEGSTFFASPEVAVVAVGILTLFALVDCLPSEALAKEGKNKSAQGGSASGRKIRLRALLIPVLFALLVLGEMYGKSVVHHPAPPYFMIKNPTSIFPKYYINEQYSYPSGHTARAVFIGITFYSLFMIHNSLFKRKKLHVQVAFGALVLLYILIVAISRIYLGAHWLSDVIGGGLLGSGIGLIIPAVL